MEYSYKYLIKGNQILKIAFMTKKA